MTTSDPLIWEYRDSLTKTFCQHVIDKFEKDPRKCVGVVDNSEVKESIKKSTDLGISGYPEWKKEDIIFYNSLQHGYDRYLDYINTLNPLFSEFCKFYYLDTKTVDSGYQIQKTKPGEYYNWHTDCDLSLALHKSNYVLDFGIRTLTYIWYLNDINYDGETEFFNGVKIKPEAGKLIFFPATWTYVHRGVSPKCETKYIVTGWMRSIRNY